MAEKLWTEDLCWWLPVDNEQFLVRGWAGLGWAAGLLGWSHQARATWRGRHPAPRTTKPPLELQTKVRETFTNTEKTCYLLLVESA